MGSEYFEQEPLRPWYASKELAKEGNATKQAGEYRQYGNLAFAIVDDSGHFVRNSLANYSRQLDLTGYA